MKKDQTKKDPQGNPEKKEGNKYDKVFKENLRELTPVMLKVILKLKDYRLQPLPQVRLQTTVEKEPDFMQVIFDQTSTKGRILQVEFEGQDEKITDWRMAEYSGIEGKIHQMEIEQHLIYFGKGWPKNITGEIKHRFYTYRYKVHCISEISFKKFLYGETPQEVVFAVLADPEAMSGEEIVHLILERLIQLKGDVVAFKKFIKQLTVLSKKRNLQHLVKKQIIEMMDIKEYEYDVFYQIGEDNGMEKGMEKGMEVGMEVGMEEKGIIAIRNMMKKGFGVEDISEILEVTAAYVKKIQKQLAKEPEIIALLKKKNADAEKIAKQMKVSPTLVKVIKAHLKKTA